MSASDKDDGPAQGWAREAEARAGQTERGGRAEGGARGDKGGRPEGRGGDAGERAEHGCESRETEGGSRLGGGCVGVSSSSSEGREGSAAIVDSILDSLALAPLTPGRRSSTHQPHLWPRMAIDLAEFHERVYAVRLPGA